MQTFTLGKYCDTVSQYQFDNLINNLINSDLATIFNFQILERFGSVF